MKIGIGRNQRSTVEPCTLEMFRKAIKSKEVADICTRIAEAREKVKRGEMSRDDFGEMKKQLKSNLPVLTPHATFSDGYRRNASAIASGMAMLDIDGEQDPQGFFARKFASNRKLLEQLGIRLIHVTPSGEGLRIVFVIPQGMTIPGAQKWLAKKLATCYDESTKDLARCSYLVPEDYILYFDEKLFDESDDTDNSKYKVQVISDEANPSPENKPLAVEELKFKDIPYSEIIKAWFELNDGEPVEGERNDKLHRLAVNLRYITDDNEDLLLQIIPRYGLGEAEMRSLIHSACTSRRCYLPTKMKEAIDRATHAGGEAVEETRENDAKPVVLSDGTVIDTSKKEETEVPLPPEMPEDLPPLIDLLVSRTPDIYKPAVAHAVFPALGAHLHRARFEYIDGVEHEATLMNVLMAGTGAGKSCVKMPIDFIMADIRKRDALNLQREMEWKQEMMTKGANKDRSKRPEGLIIQEIDPDMTNPAFVMRTAEADEHFLYTNMNEIEQFDALRGSGHTCQQFQIMCLAFDPGNRYGQTRVGAQSVTAKVQVRFNWNASTTIEKGRKYFSRVAKDGPLSRINFCTIPEREIGARIPRFGKYGKDFKELLRPYIDNLNSITGLIDCPEAYRLACALEEEHSEQAALEQSRTYENFAYRGNVIAWLKGCVLYVANGCRWDPTFETFVRWSFDYDMWCKMTFFADLVERAENWLGEQRPGAPNMITLMPDIFTLQDLVIIRSQQGKNGGEKQARNQLNAWINRGFAERLDDGRIRKTEKSKRVKSGERSYTQNTNTITIR